MDLIRQRIEPLGFVCEDMSSGPASARVRNLWARRAATLPASTLVFAGHTDVVPPGPPGRWNSPPFEPQVRGGKLYARGASDMKSSIAAFIVAAEEFFRAQPQAPLNVALLLTSDEEGPATDGTVTACRQLQARGERLRSLRI